MLFSRSVFLFSSCGQPAPGRGAALAAVTLLSVALGSVGTLGAQATTPLLTTAVEIPVNGAPRALAVGDFDENGTPDLLTVNAATSAVHVLLGQGDGSFLHGTSVPVGSTPATAAIGDFNNDTHLDAAVANFDADSVSILLGAGDGSFVAVGTVPVAAQPVSLVIADFNLDGDQDLAVAASGGPAVAVHVRFGRGTGSFQPAVTYPMPATPTSIVLGEFNGDAFQDLATVCKGTGVVTLLIGTATGAFLPSPSPVAAPSAPGAIALGDFNADGEQDLVVTHDGQPVVSVHLGSSGSTFMDGQDLDSGGNPVSVGVADYDGDGLDDMAIAIAGQGLVNILRNDGHLEFPSLGLFPAGAPCRALVSADFNGDGRTDIATANGSANSVSILLNQHGVWTDLGSAHEGSAGLPQLTGSGLLLEGSGGSLVLEHVAPSAAAVLFIAFTSTPAPFKCGTLVPFPFAGALGMATNPFGDLSLKWAAWPTGFSGASFYWQFGIQDAASSCGVALSNALRADVP